MYLTLSALGFEAGGEPAHELLAEVLATKLTLTQARCPISGVTLRKHCGAIALLALSLARSLALALIFEEPLPAQALSSPRRSARRLNSRAVSSTRLRRYSSDTIRRHRLPTSPRRSRSKRCSRGWRRLYSDGTVVKWLHQVSEFLVADAGVTPATAAAD
jgi:hypothetical protein